MEVVAVINSSRNLRIQENTLISDIKRIAHSGLPYASYLWLVTQGHSLLANCSTIPSIQQTAKRNNIPSYTTNDINSHPMQVTMLGLRPDIILCAHFNQLIKPSIYSLAKDAALNIHPSLLPDLKGVDPGFYALLAGYETTGVSLHHLAEQFDEGAVISNSSQLIDANESLFSLNIKLFQEGGNLLLDYLSDKSNQPPVLDQKPRYDSWPKTSEVARFRQTKKLITFRNIRWLFSKNASRDKA